MRSFDYWWRNEEVNFRRTTQVKTIKDGPASKSEPSSWLWKPTSENRERRHNIRLGCTVRKLMERLPAEIHYEVKRQGRGKWEDRVLEAASNFYRYIDCSVAAESDCIPLYCMSLWPTVRVTCQAKFHSTSKVPFCALICVPTCSTLKIVSYLYLTTREGNRQKGLFFP